jgi:predicted enzyme related to lactoylglutathione lyase
VAVENLFAGIPVAELEPALEWWERLMGRPADMVPNATEVAWRAIGDSGWIYVVSDPDRAGNALLTLLVDDLDREVTEIAERGLAVERIDTVRGVGRLAEFFDPDGNKVTFAEVRGDAPPDGDTA